MRTYEIRFRNPYVRRGSSLEMRMVNRIARIVSGNPQVRQISGAYEFELDDTDLWKMGYDEKTHEYIVAYGYGGAHELFMEQLRGVIIDRLSLEDWNNFEYWNN